MGVKSMAKIPQNVLDRYLQNSEEVNEIDTISIDELESFGNKESIREMFNDINSYNSMLKERITFINPSLTAVVPFTRENLYVISAYTGSGKSTIAANVSYALWKEGKRSLVISNEESRQDILMRIACLDKGLNFNAYKKGNMPQDTLKECMCMFEDISASVKVCDVNYKNGLTSKLEGVKKLLETVKDHDYSCVMIDYYQLIKRSDNPGQSTYEVLGDLRVWLGSYIKRSKVPVVLFAQLHSLGKRQNKDLDSRVKQNPEILETATVVIEVIPDFENKTSSFVIHKDRFGDAGKKITMAFDRGRFVDLDDEALLKIRQDKTEALEQQIKGTKDV